MKNILAIIVVPSLGTILACFMVLYKVVGYLPPRALNTTYLLFLISWFLAVPLILNAIAATEELKLPDFMYTAVKALIVVSLLFTTSFLTAAKDLALYAPKYHADLKARYDQIEQSALTTDSNLRVQPLLTKPRTLYYKDIEEDTDYVHNVCQAGLFGLESIAISQ